MLTLDQRNHVKDVLGDGLGINRNINFPYFLDLIQETDRRVKNLESKLDEIINNQGVLDRKLNSIISSLKK